MGVLVQIRDVPEDVHRTLKARAAREGTSLSEYLRRELARSARHATADELEAQIAARGTSTLGEPSETAVRRLRDHGK